MRLASRQRSKTSKQPQKQSRKLRPELPCSTKSASKSFSTLKLSRLPSKSSKLKKIVQQYFSASFSTSSQSSTAKPIAISAPSKTQKNNTTLTGNPASGSGDVKKTETTNNGTPPNFFCMNPLTDFPLDKKILITENIPFLSDPNQFQQIDSIHGSGGAVALNFDSEPHPSTGFSNSFSWSKLQQAGSGLELADRPLRLAVSSTGLSKALTTTVTIQQENYLLWCRDELQNFAIPGEDSTYLTGEDALVFGHCGEDNDTRHEYVPITQQNSEILRQINESIAIQDEIERIRMLQKGYKYDKYAPMQGAALVNNVHDPLGGRALLRTAIINDQNQLRVQFREKFLNDYPQFRANILSDDQLRQYRKILQNSKNSTHFLNSTLPFPVVTPLHSYTQQQQDPYDNKDISFSSLTAKEVFGKMGKDIPLMQRAVIGVSDGVGGMASYGKDNETMLMSHQFTRLIRHNMTTESTNARELLGQAHTSLVGQNSIGLGACTATIGLLRSTEPDEPEDEFDDGRRVHLSIANVGDSLVVAFRPKHNQLYGTSYVPLAVTWPMYHYSPLASPPVQFTLYDFIDKPKPTRDFPPDDATDFSTTHYNTPTMEHSGPSGGYNIFTAAKDYRDFVAGKKKLSDFFLRQALSPEAIRSINNSALLENDKPWLAQGFEDIKLRRGDIVCTFSDGISDNLHSTHYVGTVASLWESVVAYVNPIVRAQHPGIRNVRPFGQISNKKTDHLGGAILSRYNQHPLTDILSNFQQLLDKLPDDGQIPSISSDTSTTLFNTMLITSKRMDLTLKLEASHSVLKIEERPLPLLPADQKDLIYKYNYVTTQGVRYHSTLTSDEESVIAGTLSSSMVGALVRFSQRGSKIDDMSAVVAVVY